MNVQPDATTTLTIFCDGSCPVCAIEVDMLRRRDRNGQLSWIDISAPDFDAGAHGFVHADLDAVIHGVRSDGSVLRGLDVLSVAYGAAGFGGLVALTRARWLKGPSDAAYRLFARHRYRVSRVLAPVLRRIARRRAEGASS